MRRFALPFSLLSGLLPLILAGCDRGYSPNTYASTAAQTEATVLRGVIIGVRQVKISASGVVGAATGGAAGGVAGAQISGGPVTTALGAIGGTLVGGIGGTAAAQAIADTKGWEYIVDETGDKLVSVTQTSKTPLNIGLHVLVISDSQQARIVPDYTVQIAAAPAVKPATPPAASVGPTNAEINIAPVLPEPAAAPVQVSPVIGASDPAIPAPAPSAADPAVTPAAPASTQSAPAGNSTASANPAAVAAPAVQPAPAASSPIAPANPPAATAATP